LKIEKLFNKKVIQNACATQAILSILLNCDHPDMNLGQHLTEFKSFINDFDPDTKGLALSNSDLIRQVHNSFSKQQQYELEDKRPSKEEDAFHFVGYLPINGRLYELDGLKEAPIDLGPIPQGTDWTDAVKPVLEKRMMKYSEGEIHFNLMAIVSDRKMLMERELTQLRSMVSSQDAMDSDELSLRINELQRSIRLEDEKLLNYKKENIRRKHNYLPMIFELLKGMAAEGILTNSINKINEKQIQRNKNKPKK
jgi:ubiquitin carboxyl-terminal hydrolase L5